MNTDIVFLSNGMSDLSKQVFTQLKNNVSHRITSCTVKEYLLKPYLP